jgi:hypothetical protein
MGWVPVSERGINATAPLYTVPVMSVSGSTLYAAGYSSSSDSGAELWKASGRAPTPSVPAAGARRPESSACVGRFPSKFPLHMLRRIS